MFKSILVALDGSAPSNAGFKAALALSGDQDAVLHALHVIDSSAAIVGFEGGYVPPSYTETLYAGLRKSGEAILAKATAAARAVQVSVEPMLVDSRGEPVARAILRAARKAKADLIVIGTHGRRGLSRVLMGSDAEQVVREATVPVLIVRSSERAKRRPTAAKKKAEASGRSAPKAAATRAAA
ncbi:MAG TPA: universal stress protein [Casimicrobiaceae bacterium]|jgi:nucleotide-binding universal stress UspA family protein